MVDIWVEFVKALFILFPAYAANVFPPLAQGKHPIDFGRRLKDGQRIFGDGKTIEGFSFGVFMGTLIGVLEAYLYPGLNAYANTFGVSLPYMSLFIGFMIALGAMLGDLGGSFIKRRLRMHRGADAPLLDQLNFIIGSLVFAYWFTQITPWMILIMIIITPVLHRTVCILGHLLKIKREPW